MQEIQNIGDGRSEPLDLLRRQLGDFPNQLIIPGGMKAALQKPPERDFVRLVFIDVRDSQLRLPIT